MTVPCRVFENPLQSKNIKIPQKIFECQLTIIACQVTIIECCLTDDKYITFYLCRLSDGKLNGKKMLAKGHRGRLMVAIKHD